MKRFPLGTYAVWYPVIPRAESHDLPRRLKVLAQQHKKSWLHATLNIGMGEEDKTQAPEVNVSSDGKPLRAKRSGLRESGMFIINPPHTLKATLNDEQTRNALAKLKRPQPHSRTQPQHQGHHQPAQRPRRATANRHRRRADR
jgi:23S rRNA A2030 N6-methylase RlmJ